MKMFSVHRGLGSGVSTVRHKGSRNLAFEIVNFDATVDVFPAVLNQEDSSVTSNCSVREPEDILLKSAKTATKIATCCKIV